MTRDMISVHDYNNKLSSILKVIFMVIDRYGNFEFAVKLLYGKKNATFCDKQFATSRILLINTIR